MPAGVLVMPRVVKPALFETVSEKRTYLHINIEIASNCEIRCPAIIINEQNIFINVMLNEKSKLQKDSYDHENIYVSALIYTKQKYVWLVELYMDSPKIKTWFDQMCTISRS